MSQDYHPHHKVMCETVLTKTVYKQNCEVLLRYDLCWHEALLFWRSDLFFISADYCYWVRQTVWPEEGHERDFQGEVSSHKADFEQDKEVQMFNSAPLDYLLKAFWRLLCPLSFPCGFKLKSCSTPFLRKLIVYCHSSPLAWRGRCVRWARSLDCSRSPQRWRLFTLRSWCCRVGSTSRTGSWWQRRACCWLQRSAVIWGSLKSNSSLMWVKFPQKRCTNKKQNSCW